MKIGENQSRRIIILTIVSLFLVIGVGLNFLASGFIQQRLDRLVKPNDIFFENVRYNDLSRVNEMLVGITFLIFGWYVYRKKDYENLAPYIFIIGAFQWIRAGMMVLTPLAPPMDCAFGLLGEILPQYGMIPSGHTSIPWLFLLFSKGFLYKTIFFIFLIVIATTMLISRGHYSIDIATTLFVGYAIYAFTEKYMWRCLKC